ncbi:hypothetical protein N7448_011337 [Penicillium atrosanguineum]|nr:hypothetical protein N7448_011337 [Penicillium atrosanguineum]
MSSHATLEVLEYLHIYSPLLLFFLFAVASFASSSGIRPLQQELSRTMKRLFNSLSAVLVVTYYASAILHMSAAVTQPQRWWHEQTMIVRLYNEPFNSKLGILWLMLDADPHDRLLFFSYDHTVAVTIELAAFDPSSSIAIWVQRKPIIGEIERNQLGRSIKHWGNIDLAFNSVRIMTLLSLVILYAGKRVLKICGRLGIQQMNTTRAANAPLVLPSAKCGENHEVTDRKPGVSPVEPKDSYDSSTRTSPNSWQRYLKNYSVSSRHMWPSGSRHMQAVALVCFCIAVCQRIANAFVPYQTGITMEKLSTRSDISWFDVLLYVIYKWLQEEGGLLETLRSNLWDKVNQISSTELSIAVFEHVHSLSLDFHLSHESGELRSAIGSSDAITKFLELVSFQFVPGLFDFGVALGCLWLYFDAYSTLAISILILGFLYMTVRQTQTGSELQRRTINAARKEIASRNDSLVAYTLVKYFLAEEYESNRYRTSIEQRKKAQRRQSLFADLSSTCRNTFFAIGLLIMCLISARQSSTGRCSVRQFMYLITYMSQLRSSLKYLAVIFQTIRAVLIDSERASGILQTQPAVVDSPQATPLAACRGDITFEDATFSYGERKPALNRVSFNCQAGKVTALVGESGAGKSTLFRLLFRFYELDDGFLCIDGHDVRGLTIKSVRKHIGVVPQDTILLNDTIMNNVRYADPSATNKQVYAACRAASIHDQILAFPDGYETEVGERGLRLSGGERQRVALACMILKNPTVILLDEATASLDTNTEENIQKSIASLFVGRTRIVIAHRLSTIAGADHIIVLHKGQVVESGTHEELIKLGRRYAQMWWKQIGEKPGVHTANCELTPSHS